MPRSNAGINESNNTIRMNGILKKTEKLKFSAGYSFRELKIYSNQLLSCIGWNNYNKIMAGLVFTQHFISRKAN